MKYFWLLGFLVWALLAALPVEAQLFVYHVSGEVSRKARPKPVPLTPRSAVQPGQTLLLRSGAQVVLLNKAGQTLAYTTPGAATYEALQRAFTSSAAGPGRAYLAYVWGSLHAHHAPDAEHQGGAPVGGVARGDAPQLLAPLDSAVIDQRIIAFTWQAPEPERAAPVWFTLTDATGDPLLQLRAAGPTLELNATLSRLRSSTLYYWSVASTPESAASAPRRALMLTDAEEMALFEKELANLPPGEESSSWARGFKKSWFFGRIQGR